MLATALIVALALSGHPPGGGGLIRFEPTSILDDIPSHADGIELVTRGVTLRLRRSTSNHWIYEARSDAPTPDVVNQRVATALHFLQVSGPSRTIDLSESSSASLAQFGLAPARCSVSLFVDGKPVSVLEFGGLNPPKTAQYMRVLGRNKLYLMPLHVGAQWEAVAAAANAASFSGSAAASENAHAAQAPAH